MKKITTNVLNPVQVPREIAKRAQSLPNFYGRIIARKRSPSPAPNIINLYTAQPPTPPPPASGQND